MVTKDINRLNLVLVEKKKSGTDHAGIKAGLPSPADDYRHETLVFNWDYIKHPEASFYGDVEGGSMRDAGKRDYSAWFSTVHSERWQCH